jgi:transcriptional regulator with XRE-family HTH domain
MVDRREAEDVVLDDDVRLDLVEDLAEAVVDVPRAVTERTPGRLDELRELLDGGHPEDGGGVSDEVLPELARFLLDLGRRAEAHEPLLEALCLERARERLLDDEHDAMSPLHEHLPDPDAVVGRAVRALREEDDRAHSRHSLTGGCFGSKRGVVSLQFSSMDSQIAELERVDVGERLRAIRRLRRATLKTVAQRSDLSESFLSQVERGRANASVASLKRIAAALGVNVADLFEPNGSTGKPRVLRREARPNLVFGTLGRKFMLTPRPLENLQVIVGELDAGGSTGDDPYTHGDSEELLVVLEGVVSLQLGSEVFELSTGDSIDYRSSTPHRLVNIGGDPAEVMWIISPPSY